jgi:acyl-CoA synthetase (AMP-forming)/AMP-acid ligase II
MPGFPKYNIVASSGGVCDCISALHRRQHNGSALEPAEIQDFCRGKIARYKIPKYIFFTDSYPLTASGKVQKFKLREEARARLTISD